MDRKKRSDIEEKKAALTAYANELAEEDKAPARESAAKKNKRKRAFRIAAVSVVAALAAGSIAGLSVALVYSEGMNDLRAEYMRDMEGVYTRHYYDLADSANDLNVTLGKLAAADTAAAQQELLYDVRSAAELASVSLSAFEGGEEGVMQASKFVGQTGDYARYLAERLGDGTPLTADETAKLAELRRMTGVLERALRDTRTGLSEGRLFLGEGGMLAELAGKFEVFSEPDVNYPEMIYDGPFSDALEHRGCKALEGREKITEEEGAALLKDMVKGAESAEFVGRTESDVVTLNYTVQTGEGTGYAQLTEKGGLLVLFDMQPDRVPAAEAEPEMCAAAKAFAERAGYKDLAVVWSASAHGVTYVNLAPVENGVVLYPDLVKVKLDEGSGTVTGLDATHYVFNHTVRDLPAPALTLAQARAELPLPAVGEGRLALIPTDGMREMLTYEFECEKDGTYFVYIDALTGAETNILYVVSDTDRGSVLM